MTRQTSQSVYRAVACGACAVMLASQTLAQSDQPGAPPTTLPFEPTVPSAPPATPEPPARTTAARPAQPAPEEAEVDLLCTEIGPIIRAGVVASRFARLSPSTTEGAVIGRFEAGEGLASLGASYCTVTIPAASPVTADSAYNQVTCRLDSDQGDAPFLDDMRTRREEIAARLAACPSVAEWTHAIPAPVRLETETPGTQTEDHVFSHPDVAVEIIVRARHRSKSGQWPLGYLRTLDLIFRTPNPDRPAPATQDGTPTDGEG